MTQQQEENKSAANMRECMKEIIGISARHDADLIYVEHRINGQLVNGGIQAVPKPEQPKAKPNLILHKEAANGE